MREAKLAVVSVEISNDAFSRYLWYLRELPGLANDLAADIVHLSFPVPVRRDMFRCPVVVSLHDLNPYDEPDILGFSKVFFNRALLQQCLKEVDCIACVSEATLSRLRARFPRVAHRKAVVVHHCVTIQLGRCTAPMSERCPFVLMVAQHHTNKNISLAIKAFAELLQREQLSKRALFVLIGNQGPETFAIKAAIKRSALEKSVRLVDDVTDGELRWFYENCQLLIAPSLMEGSGLSVAEGLLCGSRVVCSDIPAFREVGGEACHYFDLHAKSEHSAIIAAISSALAAPAKQAERLDRFSLENVADDYAALYAQLREDTLSTMGR